MANEPVVDHSYLRLLAREELTSRGTARKLLTKVRTKH